MEEEPGDDQRAGPSIRRTTSHPRLVTAAVAGRLEYPPLDTRWWSARARAARGARRPFLLLRSLRARVPGAVAPHARMGIRRHRLRRQRRLGDVHGADSPSAASRRAESADRVRHPLKWFGVTESADRRQRARDGTAAWMAAAAVCRDLSIAAGVAVGADRGAAGDHGAPAHRADGADGRDAAAGRSKRRRSGRSALAGQVGLLYGSNAAGAIVGTLAAGLYLIPRPWHHAHVLRRRGAERRSSAAARCWCRRCAPPAPSASITPSTHRSDRGNPRRHRRQRALLVVLIVFALSGAVSLALEVVWFRVLILFVRPTVYGFSLMLATILGGIALGSYLVTPSSAGAGAGSRCWPAWSSRSASPSSSRFVRSCTLDALTSPCWPFLGRVMPDYLVYPLAASLLAIFPTALLMGIAFPIGLHLWASAAARRTRRDAATRLGLFYSVNVAGAHRRIAGRRIPPVPAAGQRASLVPLAMVSFGIGLALLGVADSRPRRSRRHRQRGASRVFAAAVAVPPDPFAEFVSAALPGDGDRVEAGRRRRDRRGPRRAASPAGSCLAMTINGNHQAGDDHPIDVAALADRTPADDRAPGGADGARDRARRRRHGRRREHSRRRRGGCRRARRARRQRRAAVRVDQPRRAVAAERAHARRRRAQLHDADAAAATTSSPPT